KYPVVIASWRNNWAKLSTYFKYDPSIRKLIYTTNTIEGFHRQVRKVTKTKGAFPSDMALLKLIYLAYTNIQKKWTHPLQNWSITVSQLAIWFEGRMHRYLAGFFEQVKSRDFLTLTIQNSHEEDQIHRSPDHWDLERTG